MRLEVPCIYYRACFSYLKWNLASSWLKGDLSVLFTEAQELGISVYG